MGRKSKSFGEAMRYAVFFGSQHLPRQYNPDSSINGAKFNGLIISKSSGSPSLAYAEHPKRIGLLSIAIAA